MSSILSAHIAALALGAVEPLRPPQYQVIATTYPELQEKLKGVRIPENAQKIIDAQLASINDNATYYQKENPNNLVPEQLQEQIKRIKSRPVSVVINSNTNELKVLMVNRISVNTFDNPPAFEISDDPNQTLKIKNGPVIANAGQDKVSFFINGDPNMLNNVIPQVIDVRQRSQLIPQKPINGIPRPPVPYEIRIMSGSAAIRYSKDTLMALSVSTDTNSVIELPASLLADAKLEKVQPNSRGFGILKFGDGNQANLFWSSKLNNKDEVVGIPAPQNQNIVFRIVDDAGRVPPIDVPVEFNLDKGGFTSGGDQKLKDAAEKLTMRSRDKQSEPPAPPPRPPVRNGKGM